MNQEKIGKFISICRKKQNLTQEQLASKLGITKNAISKWERGLSLMDMSLLKPLSEILKVSITEILNGEELENINNKTEEILEKTIDYSSKEIKRTKKNKILMVLITVIATLLCIIIFDTLQAVIFKNSPIISTRVMDKNDSDSYIDKGVLIDVYYCVKQDDIITVIPTFKNTNYNCPND